MLIEHYSQVLPGFEDMHAGLRAITCECGCGEVFWQTRVGRVRKYLNASHKARAYRAKKGTTRKTRLSVSHQLKGLLETSHEAEMSVLGSFPEIEAWVTLCKNNREFAEHVIWIVAAFE